MSRLMENNPLVLSMPILNNSANAALSKKLLGRYSNLNIGDKTLLTYVWIDGTGEHLRSKDRTINGFKNVATRLDEVPFWNFDGSSTGQANPGLSDMLLYPRAIYRDPFRSSLGPAHSLVLCDTYRTFNAPSDTNKRTGCAEVYQKCLTEDPWFGIEQEYTFLDATLRPFGWPPTSNPPFQGSYYCGVGANKVFARDLVEAHYRCCLYAGVEISGTYAEVIPSFWQFQVGPSKGLKAADDLWIARYILQRLAEEYGVIVSFDPKPVDCWRNCRAHFKFCTQKMRGKDGIAERGKAISKLSKVQLKYAKDYDPRGLDVATLTSQASSSMGAFSVTLGGRSVIVIPGIVTRDNSPYFEDRRPTSNCNPYSVFQALMETCILGE